MRDGEGSVMCGCRTDEEVPWTVSRSPMTASIPGLKGSGKHSPRRATATCAHVVRRSGRRQTVCTIPAPTYTEATTAKTTILGGLPVLNEDLVNLPNWLVLQLRIEGEDAIRLADVELLDYRHELDIRYATVVRAPSLPRSQRQGDDTAEPSVRQHGRRTTTQGSSGRSSRRTGRGASRWSRRSTAG